MKLGKRRLIRYKGERHSEDPQISNVELPQTEKVRRGPCSGSYGFKSGVLSESAGGWWNRLTGRYMNLKIEKNLCCVYGEYA